MGGFSFFCGCGFWALGGLLYDAAGPRQRGGSTRRPIYERRRRPAQLRPGQAGAANLSAREKGHVSKEHAGTAPASGKPSLRLTSPSKSFGIPKVRRRRRRGEAEKRGGEEEEEKRRVAGLCAEQSIGCVDSRDAQRRRLRARQRLREGAQCARTKRAAPESHEARGRREARASILRTMNRQLRQPSFRVRNPGTELAKPRRPHGSSEQLKRARRGTPSSSAHIGRGHKSQEPSPSSAPPPEHALERAKGENNGTR